MRHASRTALVLAGLMVATAAHAVTYDIFDLGSLGGDRGSGAVALSGSGTSVGYSFVSGTNLVHAMVNRFGQVIDIGTLGGTQSLASAVNRQGHVVGWAYPAGSFSLHAFLWDGVSMRDLGTLGGDYSNARAISDEGIIVGSSFTPAQHEHAVRWQNDVLTDLGTLGGMTSRAYDVNRFGEIVGMSSTAAEDGYHAFITKPGDVLNDIGTLGGPTSHAYVINDRSHVCGWSMLSPNIPDSRGFFWANGVMTPIETLGGLYSAAFGMNNLDQIVGASTRANELQAAFYWENGVTKDLNTMIPPGSGWFLSRAWDIDDQGVIVGEGTFHGAPRAFMLTPSGTTSVPDPARPRALSFRGASPNPVRSATRFAFSLPVAGAASLEVFDVRGRRVRLLLDGEQPAGERQVAWDGRDTSGALLEDGVYWARLRTPSESITRRVIVAH